MTWLQTASGKAFDLMAPTPEMVCFDIDVPEALARMPRFTGHIRQGPYSVAQHCVAGAAALLREGMVPGTALAFLLHDAHEAYIGDIATPIAQALVEWAGRQASECEGGALAAEQARLGMLEALFTLKRKADEAIHAAAGVRFPLEPWRKDAVQDADLRMLAAERRLFFGPSPRPWPDRIEKASSIRLAGNETRVWPWPEAADAWRAMFNELKGRTR